MAKHGDVLHLVEFAACGGLFFGRAAFNVQPHLSVIGNPAPPEVQNVTKDPNIHVWFPEKITEARSGGTESP
ncbi:MAG TPA: hypothetical protein VJ673_06440 [Aromatoleum sp.]|uniref:hypothetical protein n=1 Tax=Aromatoleum sp. TaxID=2307007 RepID=UPI002B4791CD|nr:hypothetical protein [Aromatoleum sp.]HJV25304.1 hypothetical protein [Aromatoleum sp.]